MGESYTIVGFRLRRGNARYDSEDEYNKKEGIDNENNEHSDDNEYNGNRDDEDEYNRQYEYTEDGYTCERCKNCAECKNDIKRKKREKMDMNYGPIIKTYEDYTLDDYSSRIDNSLESYENSSIPRINISKNMQLLVRTVPNNVEELVFKDSYNLPLVKYGISVLPDKITKIDFSGIRYNHDFIIDGIRAFPESLKTIHMPIDYDRLLVINGESVFPSKIENIYFQNYEHPLIIDGIRAIPKNTRFLSIHKLDTKLDTPANSKSIFPKNLKKLEMKSSGCGDYVIPKSVKKIIFNCARFNWWGKVNNCIVLPIFCGNLKLKFYDQSGPIFNEKEIYEETYIKSLTIGADYMRDCGIIPNSVSDMKIPLYDFCKQPRQYPNVISLKLTESYYGSGLENQNWMVTAFPNLKYLNLQVTKPIPIYTPNSGLETFLIRDIYIKNIDELYELSRIFPENLKFLSLFWRFSGNVKISRIDKIFPDEIETLASNMVNNMEMIFPKKLETLILPCNASNSIVLLPRTLKNLVLLNKYVYDSYIKYFLKNNLNSIISLNIKNIHVISGPLDKCLKLYHKNYKEYKEFVPSTFMMKHNIQKHNISNIISIPWAIKELLPMPIADEILENYDIINHDYYYREMNKSLNMLSCSFAIPMV